MRRYDICELKRKGAYRFVLIVQADALDSLDRRAAVPLVPARDDISLTVLNPEIPFNGRVMTLLTEQVVSVPVSLIGKVVGDARAYDYAIGRAFNMLLKGF